MNPDLFLFLNSSVAVKAVLGVEPLRMFPWDRAPANVKKPYGVYAVYNAQPENYLGEVPDIDNKSTQINIYAENSKSLEACYIAVRDALEPHAHMTAFSTPAVNEDTDLYSCTMEFDFWNHR